MRVDRLIEGKMSTYLELVQDGEMEVFSSSGCATTLAKVKRKDENKGRKRNGENV